MDRLCCLLVFFIVVSVINLSAIQSVQAYPNVEITNHISIMYPPLLPNKYENSTTKLHIEVVVLDGFPEVKEVAYRLDDQPLDYIPILKTAKLVNFGIYRTNCTIYTASTTLDNLSEGNHTITAYANNMIDTRNFTVNSFYQVTVIKVLSPSNKTYSGEVQLIFTVNGDLQNAHYFIYRGYDAVFENYFNQNITIPNLSDGYYEMYLYAKSFEKEETMVTVHFSIKQPIPSVAPVAVVILLISVISVASLLTYIKKLKKSILKPS